MSRHSRAAIFSGPLERWWSALAPFPLLDTVAPAQGPFATHARTSIRRSWIRGSPCANDGTVTAYTGKCDFGQGMATVQTQLVAEELWVAIDKVKLIQCDTSITPDQGTTSGSQSTPTNFNDENLAQAAATAREALFSMAAQKLHLAANELSVENGVVTAKGGTRTFLWGTDRRETLQSRCECPAKRRSPKDWKVLGKPVPSLDRVALMTGTFEFVHNVQRARNGARPSGAATRIGRHGGERRRKIGAAASRIHQGCRAQ